MSFIGAYGKSNSTNQTNRDDILDQDDARGFRDSRNDERFAGFDNKGPQEDGADRRAGGHEKQHQPGDAHQQAALAARAGDFQRSLNAAKQNTTDSTASSSAEAHGSQQDEAAKTFDPVSGLMHGTPGKFGQQSNQQATGQQSLSQLFAHKDGNSPEVMADEEQLLATSIATGSTMPMFATLQQPNAVQAPTAVARAQELVSAIEGRVTQAIQAELAASSASINSISINVAGLVEGLNAITIRMSATGLDVVLSGAVELAGEAQSLADRLSKRFGNRNVRVLSAPASSDSASDNDSAVQPITDSPFKRPDSLT